MLAKYTVEQVKRMKQTEPKESKYHAKKVEACLDDGTPHTFDSTREFDRYRELVLMQKSGKISDLQIQVPFELLPKQKRSDGKVERPCRYIADFVYKNENGETVAEDTKGVRTKDYIIKRKLLLWVHGITIMEV